MVIFCQSLRKIILCQLIYWQTRSIQAVQLFIAIFNSMKRCSNYKKWALLKSRVDVCSPLYSRERTRHFWTDNNCLLTENGFLMKMLSIALNGLVVENRLIHDIQKNLRAEKIPLSVLWSCIRVHLL